MEKKTTLNLNINRDDSNLNDFLICWDLFGSRPNKVIVHNTYSTELFYETFNKYVKEKSTLTEIIPSNMEESIINDKLFAKIDEETYASYIIIDRDSECSMISEIIFYYKKDSKKVDDILQELNSCLLDLNEDTSPSKLNTIFMTQDGLEIEPIDIPNQENFDIFYSRKTHKEINKLANDIKKSNKGLSILHGEIGTGKTSVINYISEKIDRVVIFIPNNMIENTINNPEFRRFLKRYQKPIIIIDDCEMLFNEVFNKSNLFVNNLIQLIDGLLSDSIEVNIITIFNVDDDSEIDHSLLECNNLLKIIKFNNLSPDESTELSNHLGFNKKYKNKTRVIDIIKNKKNEEKPEIGL